MYADKSESREHAAELNQLVVPKMTEDLIRHNAATLRAYYRERREELSEIAHLALEADGRSGWNGQYGQAYRAGIWDLWSQDHQVQLALNLVTGEIHHATSLSVCGDSWFDVGPLATDQQLAELAEAPLDVEQLLQELRQAAGAPYADYYSPQEQEARKQHHRERLQELFR